MGDRRTDDRSCPIRIAFASTYPPRHCGIATFSRDLSQAMDNREIVALTPPDHVGQYPTEVHHRVRRDEWQDYVSVARSLDRCRVDAVSIQHEYGIWGGEDGEYVLDFVNALQLPAVTTLHTVLRNPTPHQRRILREQPAKSIEVVPLDALHRSIETGVGRLRDKGDKTQRCRNRRQSKKPHVDLPLGVGMTFSAVCL